MNSEHITDALIQQYCIAPETSATTTISHIVSCEQCSQMVINYKLLFDGIKKLEKPRFEIDLSETIIPQLTPARQAPKIPVILVYILVALPVSGIMAYLFTTSLSALLVGLTPIFFWLLSITILGIIGFIGIDTYLHFKKKLNQLNYFNNLQH